MVGEGLGWDCNHVIVLYMCDGVHTEANSKLLKMSYKLIQIHPALYHSSTVQRLPVLEFVNNLWGLGTE
jgi:hypothetical protein